MDVVTKIEKARFASRRWKKEHPEQVKKYMTEVYYPKNRDKCRARSKVQRALKNNLLIRLPCEKCGNPKSEAHHENYKEALSVRWLCKICHASIHMPKGQLVL